MLGKKILQIVGRENSEKNQTNKWSSKEERRVNALALGADEGRG